MADCLVIKGDNDAESSDDETQMVGAKVVIKYYDPKKKIGGFKNAEASPEKKRRKKFLYVVF